MKEIIKSEHLTLNPKCRQTQSVIRQRRRDEEYRSTSVGGKQQEKRDRCVLTNKSKYSENNTHVGISINMHVWQDLNIVCSKKTQANSKSKCFIKNNNKKKRLYIMSNYTTVTLSFLTKLVCLGQLVMSQIFFLFAFGCYCLSLVTKLNILLSIIGKQKVICCIKEGTKSE